MSGISMGGEAAERAYEHMRWEMDKLEAERDRYRAALEEIVGDDPPCTDRQHGRDEPCDQCTAQRALHPERGDAE